METLQELWSKHSYWLIPAMWMLLSAVINLALRKKTPEQWVAFAEKNPRTAALVRLCSSLGIDLSKAILALKGFLNAKAQSSKTPQLAVISQVVDAVVDRSDEEKNSKPNADKEPEKDK